MGCCITADDSVVSLERVDILKQESESKTHEPRKRRLSGGSVSYGNAQLKDASTVAATLASKLSNGKVSDLTLTKNVITLQCSIDAREAVQILLKNKIRAAPVTDPNEGNKFIGVLDLRDTLKYSLQRYNNESDSKTNEKWNESIRTAFTLRTFDTVTSEETLLTVATMLGNGGAHIVGVLSDDNELIGVITQGELFQSACELWDDPTNNCSLQSLFNEKVISSPIKSVKYDMSAFEVFMTMSDLNLSGLAVVDEEGVLIHNTSSTDIKLWLLANNESRLKENISLDDGIEEFLINIRKQPALTDKYPITHCTLQQTMRRAMSKLQATKYHRLWIIDAGTKPIGVMAITDVLKFVCKQKAEE